MSTYKPYKDIKTTTGRQLYDLLPEVYRSRDRGEAGDIGDLAKYLDACGELVDLIRHTLDQRLADCFPDNPEQGPPCQPWLLPYFARLVDARLVSPDDRGRRDEVANAVAWRQRKGTRTAVEQIAEAVAQTETEIQEGWKRVATTARIGMPLLPATALGESDLFDDHRQHPAWAARHPGLPSAVVDLRYPSRAMQLNTANESAQNPAAHLTEFGGEKAWWRQVNPHGAPCFPGSFEDVSPRTVDIRTPGWQHGHFHPKRALLFVPPPTCFFDMEPDNVLEGLVLSKNIEHLLENHVITNTVRVTAGSLKLVHCMVKNLKIDIPADSTEDDEPVLIAKDCLIGTVEVNGLARLEYCTVRGDFTCDRLQASDSLFAGDTLTLKDAYPHCIRYSRVPPGLSAEGLLMYHNTTEQPVFFNFEFDEGDHTVWRQAGFGEPGYAVLHPATPEAIRFGAEDHGEMGAYHSRHYCLLHAAMLDKLRDFLPLGVEAVLIPDPRLHRLPILPCAPQDS